MHSERRRGKPRSRILYWFRTPPGVKVGRSALDEEAIRMIEELNPFIQFDWARILKGQGGPPSEPRVPHDVRRQRPPGRDARTERETRTERESRTERETPAEQETPAEREIEDSTAEREPLPEVEARAQLEEDSDVAAPADEVIGGFERALEDLPSAPTPAHERLGAEGVLRLRARHAELLARISERVSDPVRREELRARAESLNPDSWVTSEEVTQGLEQYEPLLASFRDVLGRRRRRRRRGNRRPEPAAAPAETPTDHGPERGIADRESDAPPDTDEPTDDL